MEISRGWSRQGKVLIKWAGREAQRATEAMQLHVKIVEGFYGTYSHN